VQLRCQSLSLKLRRHGSQQGQCNEAAWQEQQQGRQAEAPQLRSLCMPCRRGMQPALGRPCQPRSRQPCCSLMFAFGSDERSACTSCAPSLHSCL